MKMKKKRLKKRKTALIVASVILCLYSLTMLMPVYFLLVNSLKESFEFFNNVWAWGRFPSWICTSIRSS